MSVKTSQNIKFLQTKLSKIGIQRQNLAKDINEKQKELSNLDKQAKSLENQILDLQKNDETIISEHAILRYIERVLGINLDEIANKILSKEEQKEVLKLGKNISYKKDDFTVVIKDGMVVTVLGKDEKE